MDHESAERSEGLSDLLRKITGFTASRPLFYFVHSRFAVELLHPRNLRDQHFERCEGERSGRIAGH